MEKNNKKLKDIIPGFRTNTFWKKVMAIFGYIFLIFIFIVILTTPSEYGNRADASVEKIYNAVTALMIIGIPFIIITNFMGIRDKLPLFKKHKIGFTILGSFITYIVIAVGCSVTAMAATGLYSEEYYADVREAQELQEKKDKEEAEKKEAAEKKAKEEAEKKAAAEKKAKEEAEKKATVEKEAKAEAEKKIAEEKKVKEKIVVESGEYIKDVSEFEDYPFCSEEYLLYHIQKNQLKINRFANKYTQLKKFKSQFSNAEAVNVTEKSKIGQGTYYMRTRENTSLKYVGDLKDNKPDGIGVLYEKTNCFTQPYYAIVYEGGFKDGKFDGYGIEHKLPEDDFYTGFASGPGTNYALFYEDFTDDEQSNIFLSTNPFLYEGMFENGVYSGKGILYTYSIDYNTRFMEMMESNENEENDIASSDEIPLRLIIMSGSFEKGKANGKFISYDQGILAYEGDMKNDQPTGEGKLYNPLTGQLKYEGGLKNGLYHGKGTLYGDDGNVEYSGQWEYGDYAE